MATAAETTLNPRDGLCPRCGASLRPDAPPGLCPKCLGEDSLLPTTPRTVAATGGHSPVFAAKPGVTVGDLDALQAQLPFLEILGLLGQGGMGAVYKARHPGLNRLVAVKVMTPDFAGSPDFVDRFKREAQALARLSHPNIVSVHDCGRTEGGLCYFVMELVDGSNLRRHMQAEMGEELVRSVLSQICDALKYAHDEGVVHRDIKPENILIDRKGQVKIADFGLAKLLHPRGGDRSLTRCGEAMGTPNYAAPEQVLGDSQVDHRADIYSLGVMVYEMLTGELPVGRFPPPSSKVPGDRSFDRIVLRALEREPALRYQTVSDLKADFERGRSEVDGAPRPVWQGLRWAILPALLGAATLGAPWSRLYFIGPTFIHGWDIRHGILTGAISVLLAILALLPSEAHPKPLLRSLVFLGGGLAIASTAVAYLWRLDRLARNPTPESDITLIGVYEPLAQYDLKLMLPILSTTVPKPGVYCALAAGLALAVIGYLGTLRRRVK